MKITKHQILTMERSARRSVDIEMGFGNFKHKVHRTKKQYNRQRDKRVQID